VKYALITLKVAVEDYGVEAVHPLDYILPVLEQEPDVTVLEYEQHPMVLFRDYSAEKADQ